MDSVSNPPLSLCIEGQKGGRLDALPPPKTECDETAGAFQFRSKRNTFLFSPDVIYFPRLYVI